ncbi:MAG: DUF1587 domain-containing protein, partial [Planctomycetota bacterium]
MFSPRARGFLALFVALLGASAVLAPTWCEADAPTFAGDVAPFLLTYCTPCHGTDRPQANVSFAHMEDEEEALADPTLWPDVRRRLLRGEMPPEGQPRPTSEETALVLAWIDARYDRPEPAPAGNVGRVTVRRLNRVEYENTVRDLLGVDFRANETFPADDVGHGFDNIGDVLSLPPVLLEKYLLAAERIAAEACPDEDPDDPPATRYAGRHLAAEGHGGLRGDGIWLLYSQGEVHVRHAFPRDGEYVLRVQASGQQAG